MFDFDTPVERRGGDSIKWNRYAGRDVIPMWVADMDFAAPPAVLDAIRHRVDHGVFGYAAPWPSLLEAVQNHLLRHYDWRIETDWIVWLPGVVAALNVACRSVGADGDGVFSSTPVYPPFLSSPALSSRRLVTAPMQRTARRWEFEFAAIDTALAQARLWLLCHPHNPVGRALDIDELREMAHLAQQHDVVVCSDEIHCGLVLDERPHIPFARVSDEAAQRSITLMAPSKTFNIPGLYSAFAVIPNAQLRRRFAAVMNGIMPHVNTLGLVATEAAYRDGDAWHAALLDYLRGNARRVEAAVATMPGLRMSRVEATYLAWIDCRESGIAQPQRYFEDAGVGLSNGTDFGPSGDYARFVRLNFGCPRSTLDEALRRMAAMFSRAC